MIPVLFGIYFVSAFEESGFVPKGLEVVILRNPVLSEYSFSVVVQNHHAVVVPAQNDFWHFGGWTEERLGPFQYQQWL